MADEKAAATAVASENAAKEPKKKPASKPAKKGNYSNPFSYTDPFQTKFVNCLMKSGKKSLAQRILKDTFDELNRRGQEDPLKTFEIALQNATPNMEVKAKRIGGSVYQIPIEVKPKRQESLCVRWILEGARKKKGKPMFKRLAEELMDSANETGYAFTKREETHRMAQANKAFAHLARY